MLKKQKLSDADRKNLDRRIAEVEGQTKAQIVLASILRSDSYAEVPWKAFAFGVSIACLGILCLDLFVLAWVTTVLILFSVAVILASGILFAFLTVLFPAFARLFLSSERKETEVMQYAESLFLSRELFATEDRRGILLLVSQFERQVVILPDKGVREQLREDVLKRVLKEMTKDLRQHDLSQALATGLDGIRTALGSTASGAGGKNELNNEIIEEDGI